MPFGLSEKGFKRKRYIDIRNDLAKQWKEKFGENSRTVETSVNGIIISLIAYAISPLWMLAEKVYNNGFVHKANGIPLSNIVKNDLMTRRGAEYATDFIEITGEKGTRIERGFRVSRKITYVTTETVEIPESEKVLAPIKATVAGAIGNAEANTVTTIETPLIGVDSVTNPEPISGGRDEETDDELKARHELSRSFNDSPSVNGIRASVLGLEGIRSVSVIENSSRTEDSEGRPPNSFETYVWGGNDKDIAKAIFESRAAGIEPHGDVEVILKDDSGKDVPTRFTRMEEIGLFFDIEIHTNKSFPEDGLDRVRQVLIEYVGGMDKGGNLYTGLHSGDILYFTQIISLIHKVEGVVSVTSLKLGEDENNLESFKNIEIRNEQVIMTDYEKIDVYEK